MLAYLKGKIEDIGRDSLIIDVGGVGFLVYTHAKAASALIKGEEARIYTYMAVREDDISLYGFLSLEEKALFLKLISISGIGPKVALSVLSAMKTGDIAAAVISGDASAFEAVSGIGKKTAQRIVLELKEKVDISMTAGAEAGDIAVSADIQGEAVLALMGLGYQRNEAQSAVSAVRNLGDTAESLVLLALKRLAR